MPVQQTTVTTSEILEAMQQGARLQYEQMDRILLVMPDRQKCPVPYAQFAALEEARKIKARHMGQGEWVVV
ncbi:hypothetical protein AB7828_10055 [Tardiphaga sp. 215_C5_N2_1]|uniref:hypothetical protein n=1 Tax=Tardiphaga sp. 215_C5_N2_1 TaxID=3240774 RepID=UPI003F8AF3DA